MVTKKAISDYKKAQGQPEGWGNNDHQFQLHHQG